MAPKAGPKGKSAPPTPVGDKKKGKAPPVGGGPQGFQPWKIIPPKVMWMLLGTFAFVCFIVLVATAYLYTSLAAEKKNPLDEPMKKLRSTMATGLRSPNLNYENPMKVAAEVVKLPEHIEEAERTFNERKAKYQSLFRKGARNSGGWQLFGRSLYYISKGQKNWYDAENFCMSRDAHLASILSDEEQIEMFRYSSKTDEAAWKYISSQLQLPAWIGLSDEAEDGNWQWTDGSSLTIQYWSDGHPSHVEVNRELEKDCTSIVPSLSGPNWNDANCHEVKKWVCKESLDVGGP